MRMSMRHIADGGSWRMTRSGEQVRPLLSSFFSRVTVSSKAEEPLGTPQTPPPVNPPDSDNPDPTTLREQWKYAVALYSRWYSHAWGSAILAGLSFFALGWFIKGENPLLTKTSAPLEVSETKAPPERSM